MSKPNSGYRSSTVLILCLLCFLLGCNYGEERIKSRIREAFSSPGLPSREALPNERWENGEKVPNPPTQTFSPEEVRRILEEKDKALK
jgi:hypothetical protein